MPWPLARFPGNGHIMPKHICITGCTRGLGRALAEWFLAQSWRVSGFGRDAGKLQSLGEGAGDGGFFRSVDVTRDAEVASFAEAVHETWGAPDILFNNAGLINQPRPLWEVPAEEFDQVVLVNLVGVANCLRHFVPMMIARGHGLIFNLSSGWGRSTSPEVAPYCATKWAIEGLSQALAAELPGDVAVAALNPGIIDTEMLRTAFGESAAAYDDPETWAERAGRYLTSLGPEINGQALTVC